MIRFLTVLLLVMATTPVGAASQSDAPFASRYVSGFIDYWSNWFKNRNAVLFTVLIIGAVAVFIITRGKKLK